MVARCPPIVLKVPPARIFPSACSAIEQIALVAFGLKESAAPVTGSSRAMLLRVCPPMAVNNPPTKILPSGCTTMALTLPSAFGSKESASARRGIESCDTIAGLPTDVGETAAD